MKHWIIGLSSALLLGHAQACSYDGLFDNPFTEAYPGSLRVSLATRSAVEHGLFRQPLPMQGKDALARANRWLDDLRQRLDGADIRQPIAVLLTDSGLWTRFDVSEGTVLMQSHRGAQADEGILLTSEAALAALLAGQIEFEDARRSGLVMTSGPENTGLLAIFGAGQALALH
ncbi:hypothetical protein ACTSKR_13750 [Chitinibacteraceae bacterium HSL-7]